MSKTTTATKTASASMPAAKTNKPATKAPAVKSAPAAAKPTRGGELRNGIRRPTGHGVVAAIWAALDEAGKPLTREQLSDLAESAGLNRNLLGSHHRQWKLWMGHSAPKPVVKEKAAKA